MQGSAELAPDVCAFIFWRQHGADDDMVLFRSPDDDNMVTATNDFNMQKTGGAAVHLEP